MNNDWVDDYLMHHGILGQKWGVRRFQNADGTLTAAGRKRQERTEAWREKKLARVNRIYDKQDARAEKRYNKKMEKLARNPKNETKKEKATIKYNTQKNIRNELRAIENEKLSTMSMEEYYGKATARTIAAIALTSFVPYGAVFSVDFGLLDRPSEANFIEQREVGSRHGKEAKGQLAAANARASLTGNGKNDVSEGLKKMTTLTSDPKLRQEQSKFYKKLGKIKATDEMKELERKRDELAKKQSEIEYEHESNPKVNRADQGKRYKQVGAEINKINDEIARLGAKELGVDQTPDNIESMRILVDYFKR